MILKFSPFLRFLGSVALGIDPESKDHDFWIHHDRIDLYSLKSDKENRELNS